VTEFAAVSLKIETVGGPQAERTLEQLSEKGKRAMKEFSDVTGVTMDKAIAEYTRLGGVFDATMLKATDAAVKSAAAQRVAFESVEAAADRMNIRGARATQGIARGLEMVGRTGKLTGRSLDAVLGNVSALAFNFGATGALVGAIGIATAAIVEMFMRTNRELEKTQKEFNDRLGQMANSFNAGGLGGRDGMLTKLYSGDQFAAAIGRNPGESALDFTARSEGIQGLRFLQARQRAAVPKGLFGQGSSEADALRATTAKLNEMVRQYDTATAILQRVTATVVDEATNGIKNGKEKRFKGDAPSLSIDNRLNGLTGMGLNNLEPGRINDAERSRKQQLIDLQDQYVVERDTAKTTEERERALAKIAETMKKIAALSPWQQDMQEKGDGVKVAKIGTAGLSEGIETDMKEKAKRIEQLSKQMGAQIGQSFGAGISGAFETLFSGGGLAKAFESFTAQLLSGLGGMMEQLGAQMIVMGSFLEGFITSLMSLDGPGAIAAGVGLIAAGAALKAIAGSFGGHGSSGGSGGGTSGGGYASIIDRGTIMPGSFSGSVNGPAQAKANVTNNVTIIGPNDPTAQRAWDELQRKSLQRGSLAGAF
jgi:hypothetical protein